MSEPIGDLMIRLGLDGAGVREGLGKVNQQMKLAQSEFQKTSAQLGEFGSVSDKLGAKTNLLSKQIELQKARVELLDQALKKSVETKGQDAKATVELQTRLNKAQAALAGMQNELKTTNTELTKQSSAWGKYSAEADKASKGIERASLAIKAAWAAAAAALGIGIGAAVNKFTNFEAKMDEVGAKADATGAQVEALTDQAIELGAKTSFSASQAAAGMNELAAAGMTSEQIMAAMPGVLSAAAASGEEMSLVAETMASTLNAFGLQAGQAGQVADILAKAANVSAIGVQDMAYSLKYAAPVAASLGYSVEEVGAALIEMGNAGIKGEQAGTTLRGALIRLIDPPKEAANQLSALSMSITDGQGKMKSMGQIIAELNQKTKKMTEAQKAAALSAIFGTEAVSGMLVLVNQGPTAFEKYTQSLKDSAGAADEAAAKMRDNLKGSMDELSGSAESFSIVLLEKLSPAIRAMAGAATEGFNKLSGLLETDTSMANFKQLDQGIKTGFDAINWEEIGEKAGEGIAKSLAKIDEYIGKIDWVDTGRKAAGAMAGFAIGLVAGIFDPDTWVNLISEHWDTILEVGIGVMLLPETWAAKLGAGLAKIPFAGKFLEKIVKSLNEAGTKALKPLEDFGKSLLEGIGKGMGKADDLFPVFKKTIDDTIKSAKSKAEDFQLAGMEFMEKVGQGIGSKIATVRAKGTEIANSIVDGLTQGIKNRIESVKTSAGDLAETVKSKIKSALNISSPSKVMEQFGGYVSEGLAEGIRKKTSKVEEQAEQLARVVTDAGRKMLDTLGSSTELSAAKFDLAREKLGANADETERLKIDLEELQQELGDNAARVDILTAAYEISKSKLGANSEATKDYAQQLQLAKIEHEKLQVSIQNNLFEQEAAAIEKAKEALEDAQNAYDDIVSAAADAADQQEDNLKAVYDQAKETYDGIVDQAKEAYDEVIKAAEQARDQKVSSYQDELDAIDEAETKRDREATRTKLQDKIKSAKTTKEKNEAQLDLDEWLHDEQIRIQKEGIQDKIKAANDEYDDAKTAAERERDRQIAAAQDTLKIEENRYNEGLRLAKQHYKDTLAEAQTYYKTLGYSIDEVTGKLTQQTAAAQKANAAVSGGKTSGQTTQTQTPTTQTPTGTTTPTGGTQADTWRPTVGTALRYESIPGVTITPSSDGNNWYFKFSSSKGTWNRLASTIPGTSLLNGSYTITDSAAFYNFIKDLIPGYASGTGGHPGGPALIDEKENELVIEPGKKPYRYKEKGPKYVNLPKGTQVIPAYEEGTLPALTPEEQALLNTSDDELGYTQLKKKLRLIAQRTGKSSYWIQWRGMDQENYWTDTDEYIGTEPPSMFQLVYHSSLDGDGAGVESSKGMPGSHLLETEWEAFNQQIKEAYLKAGDVYTWRGEGDYTKIAASVPTPERATDTPSSEGDLIGDMQEGLSTTLGDIGNTRDKANSQIEADALTAQANNPTDKRREYLDKVSKATVELDYAQGQLDAINTAIAQATEKYGAESEEVKSFTHQQEMATIAVQSANANLRIAQRDLKAYDDQTGQWSDELETANKKLTGINSSLENANTLYTAAKKAVDDASGALSDYQNMLSDYGQTDITGTRAYDTAQHERDQATAAIDLQILEEQTSKTKGYRKRIKALEKEKEQIETENQKAALEYELSIGDQQWQLQQLLSDAKEMNFTELTSAITQTRQQIATAQSTLATAQSNLTTAENDVSFWEGLQKKQQNLISVLGTAYTTLAEKVSAFNTALNSVTTASLTSPGAATSIMSMVKLPMADAGGVAFDPMLGIWAEKRPEALIPLDRLPGLIVDSLSMTLGQRGGNLAAQGPGEMSMSFNFSGPISVRNDSDIKQVSREIFNLAQNAWRSKGVR